MLTGRLNSLRTLAEATDGLAIVDSNDLAGGLRRVVNDLSLYYLLGYYSSGKLDGKFHSIKVRVKRPGVQVRARRGYLAATPAAVTAAAAAAAAARVAVRLRPLRRHLRSKRLSVRCRIPRASYRCACKPRPDGARDLMGARRRSG